MNTDNSNTDTMNEDRYTVYRAAALWLFALVLMTAGLYLAFCDYDTPDSIRWLVAKLTGMTMVYIGYKLFGCRAARP